MQLDLVKNSAWSHWVQGKMRVGLQSSGKHKFSSQNFMPLMYSLFSTCSLQPQVTSHEAIYPTSHKLQMVPDRPHVSSNLPSDHSQSVFFLKPFVAITVWGQLGIRRLNRTNHRVSRSFPSPCCSYSICPSAWKATATHSLMRPKCPFFQKNTLLLFVNFTNKMLIICCFLILNLLWKMMNFRTAQVQMKCCIPFITYDIETEHLQHVMSISVWNTCLSQKANMQFVLLSATVSFWDLC